MGVGKNADTVYIIDFGLSKEFRHPDTYLHIPYNGAQGLVGTATFASIHSHLGCELGRRDDLESLAYILIYFLRGSLPWQGLELEPCDLIVESKQATLAHVLCQGLPVQLCTFLEYSRSLSFDSKPDYDYLHNLFNTPLLREGRAALAFDWATELDGQLSNSHLFVLVTNYECLCRLRFKYATCASPRILNARSVAIILLHISHLTLTS